MALIYQIQEENKTNNLQAIRWLPNRYGILYNLFKPFPNQAHDCGRHHHYQRRGRCPRTRKDVLPIKNMHTNVG